MLTALDELAPLLGHWSAITGPSSTPAGKKSNGDYFECISKAYSMSNQLV